MSDSERKSMLLRPMSGDDIREKIFKYHNWNGLDAYEDLNKLQAAEHGREVIRKTVPLWFGMTVLSSYNVSRMTVLSNSGRVGAVAGLVTGGIMTYYTLTI